LGKNQKGCEMGKRIVSMLFAILPLASCSLATSIDKSAKEKIMLPTVYTFPSDYPSLTKSITQTSSPSSRPIQTTICPPKPNSDDVVSSIQKETEETIPNSTVIWFDDFPCSDNSYG
jgi:hypothetical protein